MKTLAELVGELRPRARTLVPSDDEKCPKAFISAPTSIDGYIWPGIELVARPPKARVLLIEAIGAVGKSAAANAISERLNWPLIESARAQVGSYSLTGLLHDALGFDSDFMAEVSKGESGLVIDSLDEAHLRAGTSNLLAFLENVENLASVKAGEGISIVMLSRPDTATIVRLAFEDLGAPLAEARLEFFDYNSSGNFIKSYLRRQHESGKNGHYDVALRHPQSFAELRDHRLISIAESMLGKPVSSMMTVWPNVRSFLGYAPVLEVLAEALAVANPLKELNREPMVTSSSRKILLDLVQELLDREQGKFVSQTNANLLSRLPADVNKDTFESYAPREQAGRLASRMLGVDYRGELPAGVPDLIRADYEAFAEQFLQDHPFLEGQSPVNVVFGDYLLAQTSVDPMSVSGDRRNFDESQVGPFYYRFVQELAPVGLTDSLPLVDEVIVPALVSSQIKSQSGASLERSVLWVWAQSDGVASLDIFDPGIAEYLHFSVTGLTGALSLQGQLRQALVFSDEGIILNAVDRRFTIGPKALVVCDELIIDAPILRVEGTANADDVPYGNLIGARKTEAAKVVKVETNSANAITIRGSCEWPLLRPFTRIDSVIAHTEFSAYMDLRALFRFFRLGAGAAPNVFAEKLEQGIVKSNERRSRYLDKLCGEGIFWKADGHYYLDTAKLSGRSVNLQKLLGGQPDPAVFAFIRWLDRD